MYDIGVFENINNHCKNEKYVNEKMDIDEKPEIENDIDQNQMINFNNNEFNNIHLIKKCYVKIESIDTVYDKNNTKKLITENISKGKLNKNLLEN